MWHIGRKDMRTDKITKQLTYKKGDRTIQGEGYVSQWAA